MSALAAAGTLVIDSDMPLPGLCPAHGAASIVVARAAVDLEARAGAWIQQWRVDDAPAWLSCARVDEGYALRFTGVADVLIDVRARRIVYEPHDGASLDAVAAVLAGQVIPRVMTLDGTPVLHASAVAVDGRAIVLTGESGAGKSTFAAAVCAAGGELIADDFVPLSARGDAVTCAPTSSAIHLTDASLEILVDAFGATPRPLVRACGARPVGTIYLLESQPGETPRIARVHPRDAFMRLFRSSYRLDSAALSTAASEFAQLAAAVGSVPVHTARLPRGGRQLRASVDALLRSMR